MDRIKMPRKDRAKQFAPFDALKGLQTSLRLREYQHERVQKGEIQEEKAEEISRVLINLNKHDVVKIKYFHDGHIKEKIGQLRLFVEEQYFVINNQKITLDNLLDIEIVQ